MLKLDDGVIGLRHLVCMLHLLLVLARGKSSRYSQSVIMQIMFILHQKHHGLPMWTMLKDGLSCFNEEAGEMSFAMLARSVLGDTSQSHIKHLSKLFGLINSYGELERNVKEQHGINTEKSGTNWRKKIDPEGSEVVATRAFILQWLRAIKAKRFRVYPGDDKSYKNYDVARMNMVPFVKASQSLWDVDLSSAFELQIVKCRHKFISNWMSSFGDIWPEFKAENDDLVEDVHRVEVSSSEDPQEDEEDYDPLQDEEKELSADMGSPAKPVAAPPNSASALSSDDEQDNCSAPSSPDAAEEGSNKRRRDQNRMADQGGRPKPFMYDDAENVLQEKRGERQGRGRRVPDANFPMVSKLLPEHRWKNRFAGQEDDSD